MRTVVRVTQCLAIVCLRQRLYQLIAAGSPSLLVAGEALARWPQAGVLLPGGGQVKEHSG